MLLRRREFLWSFTILCATWSGTISKWKRGQQYSLGYTPEDAGAGYRRVRLTTRRRGVTVRTRDGYVGLKPRAD